MTDRSHSNRQFQLSYNVVDMGGADRAGQSRTFVDESNRLRAAETQKYRFIDMGILLAVVRGKLWSESLDEVKVVEEKFAKEESPVVSGK